MSKINQDSILVGLNPQQEESVCCIEGPLLIVAGAGTGKTKVLTHRVANILYNHNVSAQRVLLVTFTNKSANEMARRIVDLVQEDALGLWVGTFHSTGLKILRRHYDEVGLKENFVIADTEDSNKIIKNILEQHSVDAKALNVKFAYNIISRWKDLAKLPSDIGQSEDYTTLTGQLSIKKVYYEYESHLRAQNMVDFGDLLLLCVILFKKHPDVLEYWQEKFKYILIDEYQDTNYVQYLFTYLLSQKYHNLCCVGDDDQSIYSWRGADITNILKFKEDFPDARIVKLEQNYRSTNNILKSALSIIKYNKSRWGKELFSAASDGEKVNLVSALSGDDETLYIANEIKKLKNEHNIQYSQIAILVRSGYQTRAFEDRFNSKESFLPYRIYGGVKFYQRKEIKDIIAYLKLIYQPSQDFAFSRIINVPKRGLGKATLDKISVYASDNQISLLEGLKQLYTSGQITRNAQNIDIFLKHINKWQEAAKTLKLHELIDTIITELEYLEMFKDNLDEYNRIDENLKELASSSASFVGIEDFLEHVSLVSEDEGEEHNDCVSIITMHGAKGLEYDYVFLPGWESSVFPNPRSVEENQSFGLEEERRLAYVAVTRAKKYLYITYAKQRQMYGQWGVSEPSKFIKELDMNVINKIELASSNRFGAKSSMVQRHYDRAQRAKKESSSPMPIAAANSEVPFFTTGGKVEHATLGRGVVVEFKYPLVTVVFASGNTKTINASFLTRVSD